MASSTTKGSSAGINLLTAAFLAGTVFCCGSAAVIFVAPDTAINPFPPGAPVPPLSQTSAIDSSLLASISTWTPTAPSTPSAEPSATTTWTPTFTVTLLPATETPVVTATPDSGFPFLLADSGIQTTVSPRGCATASVAGHVYDPLGTPIPNLPVQLGGMLGSKSINRIEFTASLPLFGDGAFEFILAENPVASNHSLWIVLLDSQHKPISETIFLVTHEGCDRNLILVDFKQRAP